MSFLNQLEQSVNRGSQAVAQKTQNFTETNRLNKEINDLQKQLDQHCKNLGWAYYSKEHGNVAQDLKPIAAEIDKALAELDARQKELRRIKGVRLCASCGKEVPSSSAFCPNCGAPAPVAPAAPSVPVCPNCGAQLAEGAAFCGKCGSRIAAAAPQEESAPAADVVFSENF